MPAHTAESPGHTAAPHKPRAGAQLPPYISDAVFTQVLLPLPSTLAAIKAETSSPPFGDGSELSEIKAPWLQLEEGPPGSPSAPALRAGGGSGRKAMPGEEPEHRSVLQHGDGGL